MYVELIRRLIYSKFFVYDKFLIVLRILLGLKDKANQTLRGVGIGSSYDFGEDFIFLFFCKLHLIFRYFSFFDWLLVHFGVLIVILINFQ